MKKEKEELKSNVSKYKIELPCVVDGYIKDEQSAKRYVQTIKKLINDIGIKCDMLLLNIDQLNNSIVNIELALPKRSQFELNRMIKHKHNTLRDIILNIYNTKDVEDTSNDIRDWEDVDGKYYIYSNPIQLKLILELIVEITLEDENINDTYYGTIEKYIERCFN